MDLNIRSKKIGKKNQTCDIKEIENGYIITITTYFPEDSQKMPETKQYYSKENPIKKNVSDIYDVIRGALNIGKTEI